MTRLVPSILLLALTVSACRFLPPTTTTTTAIETSARTRAGVRTAPVTRGDITSLLVYPGEVRPKPGAIVSARAAGRIDRLLVEPGIAVREGDTIGELDRTALEVQVVQAQAGLAAAEARLAALKAGGEPDARAEAEASLRAAQSRLARLEAGPRIDAIPALSQAVRDARRRLAALEGDPGGAVAAAEARLASARLQLDALLTGGTVPSSAPLGGEPGATASPVPSASIEQARQAVVQAQQEVARARQPAPSSEINAARQQLADAEDALLMARWPVAPTDLDEARANVEAAEARLRRAGQPSSEAAVRAGETAVEYAGAALELARLHLREATLVAPITGIVVETPRLAGEMVATGEKIVAIQPPELDLAVQVDERQLSQVSPGQTVSVLVDVYPGESFTGTVRSISPSVDPRTRTVATRIDVQDPRTKLKSGLAAQVAIAGTRRTGALIVPREAIVGATDAAVMAVVDGRARRQAVQIGVQDGRSVEITQGLGEGTEVILSPAGILDGDIIGDK